MKFTEEQFAKHMRPITGSAIREIFKLLAKPGMISFAGGNPSNAALEPENTDYYYYALGTDGRHHFFATYAEHQAFVNSSEYGG